MKSLSTHITESLEKHGLLNDLLTKMEPTIVKMVEEIERRHNEDDTKLRPFSEWDRQWAKAMLEKDIIKSFFTYTESTDKLVNFRITGSASGQLTIDCTISRDGVDYPFNTEVIVAGGWNIQRLHWRYITKTGLPKTGDKSVIVNYENKLKKLSKGEKLQQEIDKFNRLISTRKQEITTREAMSDDEILRTSQSYNYMVMPWSEVNKDSYMYEKHKHDPDGYEKERAKEREQFVIDFKRLTELRYSDIKRYEKEIKKLEAKQSQL
jgi:hypothetical protein